MNPWALADRRNDTALGEAERGERALALALLVIMLLLRIAYVFRYRIDSDEPQHLHVVWGWTQGLLQYRDVFDNHMPLFHLLCAPLLAAIGERPEALSLMRLAMLPLYGLALWSVHALGCVLFSRRVGLWAAVLAGLFPGFFLCSVQFRTDDLWAALWLLALAVLVEGRLTWVRSLTVGILLGATLSVSMKTTLLLAALGTAILGAVVLSAAYYSRPCLRHLGLCVAVAVTGFSFIPLAVTLFFAAQGALTPFFYGTVQHNILPGLGLWQRYPERALLFPAALLPLWWGACTILRRAPSIGLGTRRVVIFLATGVYISALVSFWPLLTREDYLPFYPLLVLLLTPAILVLPRWIATRWGNLLPNRPLQYALAPALVAVLEIGLLLRGGTLWHDGTRAEAALLADVLQLTQPSDPILDLKGETVFRQRPFYYALEGITKTRLKRGLIADTIPECLIDTRTCVVVADDWQFPSRARTFLKENYLPVGHLCVAGRLLTPPGAEGGTQPLFFDVQIPAQYAIVAESGGAAGWLDGTPYQGARFLVPGRHEYRPAPNEGRLALVWAQAVERGFSPFPLRSESR